MGKMTQLRRTYVTQRLLKKFISVLPPMSETEQQAIAAGDVSFEKELFQGNADWNAFFKAPALSLTSDEQNFLDNQVQTLCQMLNDWEIVQERGDLPPKVWDYLKKEKFFGMIIPKAYGGLEFSALAHSAVIIKIATRSVTTAVTTMVPNSLGPAELLLHYGTQAQKDHYLPRLAVGVEIPCFGLTSPEAGSDASSMTDSGIVCKGLFEGKETIGIRLNFDKRYITLAPIATVMGLAFKLSDPEQLIGEQTDYGITVCLLPMSHPGVEAGDRHFPLNMPFMNGPIRGKDVFIPIDWIIGGKEMAGKGWPMLMECLAAGRGISLPALSTASGMGFYQMTGAYSAIRRQFSLPIGQFEGVSESLARIAGYAYMLRAMRQLVATSLSQGKTPGVATSIVKYHSTEFARKLVNDAMDVHGGKAIMLGPLNYLARAYQATPVSITVEGANILTRCLMIFGQGAFRCHPYVQDEMKAVELYQTSPEAGLLQFDDVLMKHAGYFLKNWGKTLLNAASFGWLAKGCDKPRFNRYVKQINWMSTSLAFCTDVTLMVLGGELKRKETLSARLGDVLSYLYLCSAVLKFADEQDPNQEESDMVQWSIETLLHLTQEAFYGFFQNFPSIIIGTILKRMVFPFGRWFNPPKDTLGQRIVQPMMTPSAIRQRMSALCFLEKSPKDGRGIIELTFEQLQVVKPVMDTLTQAIKNKKIPKKIPFEQQVKLALENKIITEQQKQALQTFDELYRKAIAVDEFPPTYHLGTQFYASK